MKKFLITVLLSTLSLAASAETIRFATEATYPPFETTDASGKIVGFDVDLANLLCQQIHATCTFQNQSFDSLISGLKFRRFEAAMAGIDITPDREKQVLFTDPYYDNAAMFVSRTGAFTSIEQLKGKRVGVQNGTTHQRYIQDRYPQIKLVPYDSYQNARLDLENGRIDAIFGDNAVVSEWLKPGGNLVPLGDKITDKDYFGRGIAIALRKDNTELQQKLNAALAKVRQDGSYQVIYNKWFENKQ